MNQEYTKRLQEIEAELERWLQNQNSASISYNDIFPGLNLTKLNPQSLNALFEPIRDMISRGGKRWRPLLMTLVCEALGGGADSGKNKALVLTPLIEFCHNGSLIHDDLEDNSDQRRGKPAVHHLYGIDTAINSGAFLYFLSLCCIELYDGNKEMVYKLYSEYMRKLHLGQAMDISWHRDVTFVPKIEEYYIMCGLKTGSLARLAAELGAIAAGAPQEVARKLGETAEKLGVGFQILDDIKNLTTGNPGKKRGDDVVEGKKSLPVLLYLHKYPEKQEQIFYCFYQAKENGETAPEIEELIDILTEAEIFMEAEKIASSLIKEARDIFDSVCDNDSGVINEEGRALLNGLIDLIS
ncbi:MAG: polyprenyl synthetase family protein [Treponema sp.]|jgi:octaprenyl-diphosphate synthase|nr:polyprenyl synthetase family protein [Treponema sp.]